MTTRKTTAALAVPPALTLILTLILPTATQAQSDVARLQECRKLNERIEHYTGLRRRGGSAGRMQGWKKQLRKYEARFRSLECSDFRRELR